jgi:hypothetical protein
MVIPSFRYHGDYHRMVVNCHSKSFITLAHGGIPKYYDNLPWYLNPRKSRVKFPMVNYQLFTAEPTFTRVKILWLITTVLSLPP